MLEKIFKDYKITYLRLHVIFLTRVSYYWHLYGFGDFLILIKFYKKKIY